MITLKAKKNPSTSRARKNISKKVLWHETEKVSEWYKNATRLAEMLISDPINQPISLLIAEWYSSVSRVVREYVKEIYSEDLYKTNPKWKPHFDPISLEQYLGEVNSDSSGNAPSIIA